MDETMIERFKNLYFTGITDEAYYQARVNLIFSGSCGKNADLISVFSIKQITDINNEEQAVENMAIFIQINEKIFHIVSLTTINSEIINFCTDDLYLENFSKNTAVQYRKINQTSGMTDWSKTISFKRKGWREIKFTVEITKVPGGPELIIFRQALFGLKFKLDLYGVSRQKNGNYLIPKRDIIPSLEINKKFEAANFYKNQAGEYITIHQSCLKLE